MSGIRRFGKRRLGVVVANTLGLTMLAGGFLVIPAFAADTQTSPAALEAHQQPLVPGTPCTVTARSCVDLETQRAWLIDNGKIVRGPVKVSSGGNGKETPVGHSLRVYRKEQDHKSLESRIPSGPKKGQPAPMPWAVFFEDGGIAFHGGDPQRSSAGCIHLPVADAQAWFNYLQIGDQVQVVKKSEELAARAGTANSQPNDERGKKHDNDDDDRDRG